MATVPINQTSFFNLPLSIQRLNPRPLDSTSVWNSLEDAKVYAKTGATAHVGQILSVVETLNGVSNSSVYIIQNESGLLKRVDTFNISEDGSLVIDNNVTINGWGKFNNGIYINHGETSIGVNINKQGALEVDGSLSTTGLLTAIDGFILGTNKTPLISSVNDNEHGEYVSFSSDVNIEGHGIKINQDYVINLKNDNIVAISSPSRILNFGDYGTSSISLQADIYNEKNDAVIVSRYGDGNFANSFKASYGGQGKVLISTYKNTQDVENEGVLIRKNLTFETELGPSFSSVEDKLIFTAPFYYNNTSKGTVVQENAPKKTSISYKESDSLYAVLNNVSSTLVFNTEADFYEFNKPIEGKSSIGISGSKTQLTSGQLFFNDSVYFEAIVDGIKYYGNSYFTGSTGSVEFSSGFAGSGWQIAKNQATGNIVGTFDELVIRKKMRIYELEVQKISSTNGALWVSDNCSGDSVTLID